jgi:hypothetical protein
MGNIYIVGRVSYGVVDDDIYGNKQNYERFVRTLDRLKVAPGKDDGKRKYWVKYTPNLAYFRKLIKAFEVRDNSYIDVCVDYLNNGP